LINSQNIKEKYKTQQLAKEPKMNRVKNLEYSQYLLDLRSLNTDKTV